MNYILKKTGLLLLALGAGFMLCKCHYDKFTNGNDLKINETGELLLFNKWNQGIILKLDSDQILENQNSIFHEPTFSQGHGMPDINVIRVQKASSLDRSIIFTMYDNGNEAVFVRKISLNEFTLFKIFEDGGRDIKYEYSSGLRSHKSWEELYETILKLVSNHPKERSTDGDIWKIEMVVNGKYSSFYVGGNDDNNKAVLEKLGKLTFDAR